MHFSYYIWNSLSPPRASQMLWAFHRFTKGWKRKEFMLVVCINFHNFSNKLKFVSSGGRRDMMVKAPIFLLSHSTVDIPIFPLRGFFNFLDVIFVGRLCRLGINKTVNCLSIERSFGVLNKKKASSMIEKIYCKLPSSGRMLNVSKWN